MTVRRTRPIGCSAVCWRPRVRPRRKPVLQGSVYMRPVRRGQLRNKHVDQRVHTGKPRGRGRAHPQRRFRPSPSRCRRGSLRPRRQGPAGTLAASLQRMGNAGSSCIPTKSVMRTPPSRLHSPAVHAHDNALPFIHQRYRTMLDFTFQKSRSSCLHQHSCDSTPAQPRRS